MMMMSCRFNRLSFSRLTANTTAVVGLVVFVTLSDKEWITSVTSFFVGGGVDQECPPKVVHRHIEGLIRRIRERKQVLDRQTCSDKIQLVLLLM